MLVTYALRATGKGHRSRPTNQYHHLGIAFAYILVVLLMLPKGHRLGERKVSIRSGNSLDESFVVYW